MSSAQRPDFIQHRHRSICFAITLFSTLLIHGNEKAPIDRQALVQRHCPIFSEIDPLSALSLGNGRFAFTADITGLQTFDKYYGENGIPLSIQSEWGWHSFPNPNNYRIEETYKNFDTNGRPVPYPYLQHSDAGQWLRGNPHRIGLGKIGLAFLRNADDPPKLNDIRAIEQKLDLWTGHLHSSFTYQGSPVKVTTVCDPHSDTIAVEIVSELIASGSLGASLEFAYGTSDWGIIPEDWSQPEKHESELAPGTGQITRTLDTTEYHVSITGDASIKERAKHRFQLSPANNKETTFRFAVSFASNPDNHASASTLSFAEVTKRSKAYWEKYWSTGGAVDLSQSTDPRARELERRIVLSQYLTAIQCRGSLPPQETGLTFNSWYGKPHLEMHWWHATHFALWDRIGVVEAALQWYQRILPQAQSIAHAQGYDGARWPKNVDKDGNQVPSTIAPLLIWQQAHPIYFAELYYRQSPSIETLETYKDIVFQTAEFMAAFPYREDGKTYKLGPPLIPAQESYDPETTSNPPFELAYWRWGLATAQTWRTRLGLPTVSKWDEILEKLAPYPEFEDRYATAEGVWNDVDHPSVLAAFGMINGPGIDQSRMSSTLSEVMQNWPWEHTWGWDYPMIAMTAARLGHPDTAIEALLLDVPQNTYLPNGHNFQQQERLRIYLPGNGGLLAAVAMMVAGWDGAPDIHAPGFPQDGSWIVKWENLHPMP